MVEVNDSGTTIPYHTNTRVVVVSVLGKDPKQQHKAGRLSLPRRQGARFLHLHINLVGPGAGSGVATTLIAARLPHLMWDVT